MSLRPFVFLVLVGNLAVGQSPDTHVSIEKVSTQRSYGLATLRTNVTTYIDRDYRVLQFPSPLLGAVLVQTANDDDGVTAVEHLHLELTQPASIYVCWDRRAYRPAPWLKGWERIKGEIVSDDTRFHIYHKAFSAGEVVLGSNQRPTTGASSNYFAIVSLGKKLDLEVAGVVDDQILSTRRPTQDGREPTPPGVRPPTRAPSLPAGFAVKLYAYEPMVHNPCAICFDDQGRLIVGFGPQYRKPRPDTPGDQVAILIDDNDDGVADRRQTFAQGFNSIQGLAWNGDELWVANAPDLTVVRDLDGDDVADEYVRLYTDLGNLEHGLHGLQWAPDGRLYMSKGNSKGHNRPQEDGRVAPKPFRDLFGLAHPSGAADLPPPVKFDAVSYPTHGKGYHNPSDDWGREGGILRCGPMGRNLEIVSQGFRNPWDIAFDHRFDWLGTDNDQDLGDKIFTPFFGAHFGWGHPWSYRWNDRAHVPTVPASAPLFEGSGTGVVYYGAKQFPPAFRNVFLINDWLRQTTFAYDSSWDGALRVPRDPDNPFATFAQRPNGGLYKPTDLEVGPDGALYVCSWGVEYGAVWRPGEENQTQINEGRIYRIWYTGNPLPGRKDWHTPKRQTPRRDWTVTQLIEDLGADALPIWRVNAQNELVRRDVSVRSTLIDQLATAKLDAAQATWTLWALGRMSLSDPKIDEFIAGIAGLDQIQRNSMRIQALRILGFRWRQRESSQPLPSVVTAALRDQDAKIRFEAVQAIWQSQDKTKLPRLLELAASEQDQVVFYTLWHAIRDLAPFEHRKALLDDVRPGVRFAALMGIMDAFELSKDVVLAHVEKETDPRMQKWGLKWVLAGKPPRTVSNQKERVGSIDQLTPEDLVAKLEETQQDTVAHALFDLLGRYSISGSLWDRAGRLYRRRLDVRPTPHPAYVGAMLHALRGDARAHALLWEALGSGDQEISEAALQSLRDAPDVHPFLVDQLSTEKTTRQAQAMALLADAVSHGTDIDLSSRVKALIDVFEETRAPRTRGHIITLLTHAAQHKQGGDLRPRMTKLALLAAKSTDRRIASLVPRFAAALETSVHLPQREPLEEADILPQLAQANPDLGRRVFFDRQRANCLNCHRVENQGTSFAPSLSDVGRRLSARQILESILHPSRRITEGFQITNLIDLAGQTHSGVIKSETASMIQLFQADGREVSIAKDDVDERITSPISIMPANFGLLLTKDELANLVAWLTTLRAESPAAVHRGTTTASATTLEFSQRDASVVITANGHPVATYIYEDATIPRPYLKQACAPGGIQVTRNHPPEPGDPSDHATYHPGIFLAFGDISGHDYWRLKARVKHDGFVQRPSSDGNRGSFEVRNRYLSTDGEETVCVEHCRLTFTVVEGAYQLDWDSRFRNMERGFSFGDQEEMGLGVRIATPLRERGGQGRIVSSTGLQGAKKTWGQAAAWCDYAGPLGTDHVGVTIMTAPTNPRPSWWHNRDYGVFVANLFGRRAMKQGSPSRIEVKPGETFRVRYRILLHAALDAGPNLSEAYAEYVNEQ